MMEVYSTHFGVVGLCPSIQLRVLPEAIIVKPLFGVRLDKSPSR